MADSANINAVAAATLIVLVMAKKRRRKRERKIWVREWIKNRPSHGAYHHLLKELQLGDQVSYKHFLRMDVGSFESLLSNVRPMITYKDTHFRKAIPPGERLALTLRFLATGKFLAVTLKPALMQFFNLIGESYSSLQYLYRIPSQTIGKIVIETCKAIVETHKDYLKVTG